MKLTINNSLCSLEGLSIGQFKELREILSYDAGAGGYYSGNGRPTKRYLLDKKGSFPTGLLYLVERWIALDPLRGVKVIDLRIRPAPRYGLFNAMLDHEPYPEQDEAALFAYLEERGIICAPTGLGKSVIIALIIHRLQVTTLVVVPSLELKRQLNLSLISIFGNHYSRNLKVENVDALDPKVVAKYDCVIIDEFHHSGASTYRKLNKTAWAGVYYKFGLTATPFRSNDNERLLLESVLSKVIYQVPYEEAVANKRIVPLEAYYIDVPPTPMKGNPNSWPAVYSELIVNNEARNNLIASLMARIDAPTLTLIKEIQHGVTLSTMTGAPFANGEDGEARMRVLEFNLGETRRLIGSSVISEGVDTKPAEWILLAGGGKSKNQFMQAVGRGFRVSPGKESCKVIMFRDKSNKFLLRHFNACVKHLRDEYGIKPVRLEL